MLRLCGIRNKKNIKANGAKVRRNSGACVYVCIRLHTAVRTKYYIACKMCNKIMNMILNNNQPDFYPKRRQQQQQPNLRGAIEM